MKKFIRIYLLAGVTLIPGFRLKAQELRAGIDFDRMILSKVEFHSKFQARTAFIDQLSYYAIAQTGLEYEIIKELSLAGTVRYSLGTAGGSEDVISPLFDKMRYTLETKFKSKRFDNGVRLRYRLRYQRSKTQQDNTRDYLRNRLILDYKFNKELNPYVAGELYFRLGENEVQRFRLYLGTEIQLCNKEAELSYILEGEFEDSYFQSFHMIGVSLRI